MVFNVLSGPSLIRFTGSASAAGPPRLKLAPLESLGSMLVTFIWHLGTLSSHRAFHWTPFGSYLGSPGLLMASLGLLWVANGSLWGPIGAAFGCIRTLFGCTGAAFGSIGATFGCTGAAFGCTGAAFGCTGAAYGCTGAACTILQYMQYMGVPRGVQESSRVAS